MAEQSKQFLVLGHPIHLLEDYSGWLVSRLQEKRGAHVVTLNAEMTMQAETDVRLASIIAQADLVVPDGSGIVFYFWLQGRKVRRCPGIELAESLLSQMGTVEEPIPTFFFGGAPGTAETAAKLWQERGTGLSIAGTHHGYLTPELEEQLQQTLQQLQPQVILVGLGVPRQEYWIAEHRHLCPNALWIGVGGSFDIWAGNKSRAPNWMRTCHLEWAYRLYQEPWRWRRMMALPKFVGRAIAHRLFEGNSVSQLMP